MWIAGDNPYAHYLIAMICRMVIDQKFLECRDDRWFYTPLVPDWLEDMAFDYSTNALVLGLEHEAAAHALHARILYYMVNPRSWVMRTAKRESGAMLNGSCRRQINSPPTTGISLACCLEHTTSSGT